MDITAIIAEYNPFHNGHLFHLQKTKEAFPDSATVAILGGSFTQRGEPALKSEHDRALWAIKSGFDAVVRLPVYSSFSDGENFARAGVRAAQKLGATRLSFGSESGDLKVLSEIADILDKPIPLFNEIFDKKISSGSSYPRAISETFKEVYPNENYSEILKKPNDILAILYLKALKGTKIEPFCVKRCDNGYDSNSPLGDFLSASGIRLTIEKNEDFSRFLPPHVCEDLKGFSPPSKEELSSMLLYKIRTIKKEELSLIQDVTEGLENRIKRFADSALSISELLTLVKTKRYTLSRLKRILLYTLFDVTKDKFEKFKDADYLRLLAIKKENVELLSSLGKFGVVKSYADLNEEQILYWEEENKMADVLAILLKRPATRNALFV